MEQAFSDSKAFLEGFKEKGRGTREGPKVLRLDKKPKSAFASKFRK
ncbi:hypothetical protein OCF11_13815 [Bacillus cereus]|nr:hypothetical protein [Bacillus cereus]